MDPLLALTDKMLQQQTSQIEKWLETEAVTRFGSVDNFKAVAHLYEIEYRTYTIPDGYNNDLKIVQTATLKLKDI